VLNLFSELKRKLKVTMLFISHDLNVVEYLADTVAVMYAGKIMEIAPVEEIFKFPLHPYTQGLMASNPSPESYMEKRTATLRGEVLLPLNPPPGCRLEPRCPLRVERCKSIEPLLAEKRSQHSAACHEV
jgi:oligopeptide/dipeptide ABC transporter ATP-binding protein